jgi:hypothetical protein
MMMKKIIAAALVAALSFYLSQCGSQKEKDTPGNEITTVKEKTDPLDIEFTLENSVSITETNSPGKIFFNENILHVQGLGWKESGGPQMIVIHRYAKNLEPLDKKYIPIGQGPGDLGNSPRFSGCGELIYASCARQYRITVFNKDLEFVKVVSVRAGDKGHRILYLTEFNDDGTWFLCAIPIYINTQRGMRRFVDYCVGTFPDFSIKVFETYGPYYPFDPSKQKVVYGRSPGAQFFRRNSSIYYINMNEYKMGIYDTGGNCLKKIRVLVDRVKVPESKRVEWLIAQSGSRRKLDKKTFTDTIQPASWMVPLGKGFVVVRRYTYAADCEGKVEGDYFSYELEMKGKVKIPCFLLIFKLGNPPQSYKYKNGYLYLIKESRDDYRLEKWLVQE